ncbi:MAG: ribonuclease P protein component [Myxococcota bacterium]
MTAGRYGSLRTLRKRSDFLHVQSKGCRAKGRHLVVLALRSQGPKGRVGFTVSKKVGGAVIRNRVRRQLRELIRQGRVTLPDQHDVVIIAYPAAAGCTSTALLRDLQKSLSRLSLSRPRV